MLRLLLSKNPNADIAAQVDMSGGIDPCSNNQGFVGLG
jgi:hypothetical protein